MAGGGKGWLPSLRLTVPLVSPEQYAVDELVEASLQQVEIDAQVILYLEMTQVRLRCSSSALGGRQTNAAVCLLGGWCYPSCLFHSAIMWA